MMLVRRSLLAVLLLLGAGLVGAAAGSSTPTAPDATMASSVHWMEGSSSSPYTTARYPMLDGQKTEVVVGDGTLISTGLFLPSKPGCDWDRADLPDRCRLPVVLQASPYYLDRVDEPSNAPPVAEWLVPRGYAVVQMSLRGTGESGGCYEFKNPQDVQDVSDVIDHLAAQPWSNGNVGMVGFSYDGTAAWAGAASGNPHLKTVVPISATVDAPGLYYKNGTSESRGPATTVSYYPTYSLGIASLNPTYRLADWTDTACPDQRHDWTEAAEAALTGSPDSPYWRARDLTDDVLTNYEGSVWAIHGLEDWNVDPGQVVPFTKQLRDQGIDTRLWLGQWEHTLPDDATRNWNARLDFANELVDWADHYLKEEGSRPLLGAEVEDSRHTWRTEASYPPEDARWRDFEAWGRSVDWFATWTETFGPFRSSLRIQGTPRLHFDAVPYTPTGGELFAQLHIDFKGGGSKLIGWSAIDLQYHDGGNTDPVVLVPGQPVRVKMQFQPMDAHLHPGDTLRLEVKRTTMEGQLGNLDPTQVIINQVTLSVPLPPRR